MTSENQNWIRRDRGAVGGGAVTAAAVTSAAPNGPTVQADIDALYAGLAAAGTHTVDTFSTASAATAAGTDTFGNPVAIGDPVLTLPDGSTANLAHTQDTDTDTDTYGIPSNAAAAGTDAFGVAYAIGDAIVTFPDGSVVAHTSGAGLWKSDGTMIDPITTGQALRFGSADVLTVGARSIAGGTATASGDDSAAFGRNATASGLRSFAAGNGVTASGLNSAALGQNTVADGSNSFAAGNGSSATGTNATATGNATTASGSAATSTGSNTVASGGTSFAANNATTASGTSSSAFGSDSKASGATSWAAGSGTLASGVQAFATGRDTVASGDTSFTAGISTTAAALAGAAFGRFSALATGDPSNVVVTDPLFQIGNGTATTPANAITVLQDGKTGFNNVTAPAYEVEVSGDVAATGAFLTISDKNEKTGIADIDAKAAAAFAKIKPRRYKKRVRTAAEEEDRDEFGLLAQDIEKGFPELVVTRPDGVKLVNYQGMIPLLMRQMQAMQAEITALKKAAA